MSKPKQTRPRDDEGSAAVRRIWLVTPTRGRIDNLDRLHASIRSHAEDPANVALVLGIDEDDEVTFDAAQRLRQVEVFPRANVGQYERLGPVGSTCATYWHLALKDLVDARDDDLVMLCADDIVFETPGFDRLMLENSREHGWLYYGADGYQSERPFTSPGPLATHPWFTAKTVQAMGGLATGRWAVYNDTFLWVIFTSFETPRVTYLPEIKTTHVWQGENPRNDVHRGASFEAMNLYGGQEARRRIDALRAAECLPADAAQVPVVRKDGLSYRTYEDVMVVRG